MEDPVPAIAEAAATGETAAIFADIRAVLGVGVVNLIWRHLATIEGALPWAWRALRPAYAGGALAVLASGFEAGLPQPEALPLPAEVMGVLGLDAAAQGAIAGVLAAYARTNPLALVALSALALRLEGAPAAAAPVAPIACAETAVLPLPPLPRAADLSADTIALIRRLNALGATRPDAVLATMYRHLAHWPAALVLAWTVLAPRAADGSLDAAIAACRRSARRVAVRLPSAISPPLPAASRRAVADALDRFSGEVLPRMVVVCGMMRHAFGP